MAKRQGSTSTCTAPASPANSEMKEAPKSNLPVPAPAGQGGNPNQLQIVGDGRSRADLMAESALSPAVTNGLTTLNFLSPRMAKDNLAETGIASFVKQIAQQAQQVVGGDLSSIETALTAQFVTLNAGMADMLHMAQLNRGKHLGAMETYMRLGLKFQAQALATVQTLTEMKNPRPVFAKNFNAVAGNQQLNQTTGPQQVNNAPARKSVAHKPK